MLTSILNFKPVLIGIAVGTVIGAASCGAVVRWYYRSQLSDLNLQIATAQADFEKAKTQHMIEQMTIWSDITLENVKLKYRQEAVHIETTKEIEKYVQNPDTGKCVMRPDFVQRYNSAVNGSVSGTAPGTGPVHGASP
jgi:hypothetical protein